MREPEEADCPPQPSLSLSQASLKLGFQLSLHLGYKPQKRVLKDEICITNTKSR